MVHLGNEISRAYSYLKSMYFWMKQSDYSIPKYELL